MNYEVAVAALSFISIILSNFVQTLKTGKP